MKLCDEIRNKVRKYVKEDRLTILEFSLFVDNILPKIYPEVKITQQWIANILGYSSPTTMNAIINGHNKISQQFNDRLFNTFGFVLISKQTSIKNS